MVAVREHEQNGNGEVRADRGGEVMAALLVVVAVLSPLVGSLAVLVGRRKGLGAGRVVTVACGVAFVAALGVAVVSALRSDGLVDGAGGWGPGADRASALLLCAVTATGAVVGSFACRSVDLDTRGPRFFVLFGILVAGSSIGGRSRGVVGTVDRLGRCELGIAGLGRPSQRTGCVQTSAEPDGPSTRDRRSRARGGGCTHDRSQRIRSVAGSCTSDGRYRLRDGARRWCLRSRGCVARGGGCVPVGIGAVASLVGRHARCTDTGLGVGARWFRQRRRTSPGPIRPIVLGSFVAVHLAFALAIATVTIGLGASSSRIDVKGRLAWSTVAQMGFMVLQCTVGALSSAVFHIIGHGMYKASMFLGAGDAISAGLRTSRRPPAVSILSLSARLAVSLGVSTAAVGLGWWVLPPEVPHAGVVLIVVFAWATTVHGVWGWLGRGPISPPRAVAVGGGRCCRCRVGVLRRSSPR